MKQSSHPAPDLNLAALLGELARPAFHECNNFLNNCLLQFALIEEALPESLRADLASLRNQGKRLANLIAAWQGFRKPGAAEPVDIDLRDLLDEVVDEIRKDLQVPDSTITLKPGSAALTIRSTPGPLKRLCYFLVADAVAAASKQGAAGRVEIQSRTAGDSVQIEIHDNRAAIKDGDLAEWFRSGEWAARDGALAIAACVSLANRRRVGLHAERSPLGGICTVISAPASR